MRQPPTFCPPVTVTGTTRQLGCAWCHQPFTVPARPGPAPSYCRRSHRQRALQARRLADVADAKPAEQAAPKPVTVTTPPRLPRPNRVPPPAMRSPTRPYRLAWAGRPATAEPAIRSSSCCSRCPTSSPTCGPPPARSTPTRRPRPSRPEPTRRSRPAIRRRRCRSRRRHARVVDLPAAPRTPTRLPGCQHGRPRPSQRSRHPARTHRHCNPADSSRKITARMACNRRARPSRRTAPHAGRNLAAADTAIVTALTETTRHSDKTVNPIFVLARSLV